MAGRVSSDRSIRAGHRRIRLTTAGRRRRPAVLPAAHWRDPGHAVEVATDQARLYPAVPDELLPAAWHRTDRYANNRVECDHGRLKARLRPMRGLKQDRSARVIIVGHAFIQNIRRGHYELAVDERASRRVAVAFDELAMAI
jgi:transposase-like protein